MTKPTRLAGEDASGDGASGHPLPVVLLHGYLGGAAQWRDQVAALAGRFRVVAIDLPGFGAASDQPAPASIGGFASHVVDTLDTMGVSRFMLLGHSMGGMIAQEVARRIPARIDRLALYGTGPLGLMPDRFEPLERSVARLDADGLQRTARRIVATWFVRGEAHPGFETLSRIAGAASPGAARSALSAMARWDGRAHLSSLDMPVLIVWGDRDRSYRWPQIEALWRGLPDAALAVIPGASHAAHLEKPEIFRAILADFLAAEQSALRAQA